MKILWIAPIRFGETIHQVGEIGTAKALCKRGWSVDFLSADTKNNGIQFMRDLGFGIEEIKMSKIPGFSGLSFNYSVSKKLRKVLQRNNYDIIIVEWQAILGFLHSIKRNSSKIYFPPWIMEDRSPPANNGLTGRLQWLLYDISWKLGHHRADAIEVLVPGLGRFVNNRFNLDLSMVYCPSGVDIDRFYSNNKPLSDKIKFIYHGSLDRERGLERIISFGIKLKELNIDFTITIFGAGSLHNFFVKSSKKYDWLYYLGKLPYEEVPKILSEQDIGILPLPDKLPWNVGSPLKAMEYAASGLITLATDVDGSIPFKNFDWFFTGSRDDPIPYWVEKVKELKLHKDDFINLRISARNDAESELTWDSAVDDLDKKLKELISND